MADGPKLVEFGGALAVSGSPYEFKAASTTIVVECKMCDKHGIVVLLADIPAPCPACGHVFWTEGFTFNRTKPADTMVYVGSMKPKPKN